MNTIVLMMQYWAQLLYGKCKSPTSRCGTEWWPLTAMRNTIVVYCVAGTACLVDVQIATTNITQYTRVNECHFPVSVIGSPESNRLISAQLNTIMFVHIEMANSAKQLKQISLTHATLHKYKENFRHSPPARPFLSPI